MVNAVRMVAMETRHRVDDCYRQTIDSDVNGCKYSDGHGIVPVRVVLFPGEQLEYIRG